MEPLQSTLLAHLSQVPDFRILMANTSGLSNWQAVGTCGGLCVPLVRWRILGALSVPLW